MQVNLRRNDIRQYLASPAHHRRRGFVAACLDTQDGEGLARHGGLLYAEKLLPQRL
jgi:hypothetical protein